MGTRSPLVSAESGRTMRYRTAERALWEHYDIEPRERFVEVASPPARLRVSEVGAGVPLLFVHGTAGLGPYWAPLVRGLDGYRCLMVDRPGWGLTSAVDYSKHDYGTTAADLLRGVLDAFGVDRAHVVGASLGDVWALRLAGCCPERVQRVVLLGGGPLLQDVAVPKVIRLLASPLGAIMVRAPEKPGRVRSVLRAVGHGASLDDGSIPDEYLEWRAALGRYTDSMRHERDMVRTIVRGHGFEPKLTFDDRELAGISHPTLLVYGKADPTGPLDLWERFIRALPHGSLHVMDGGHMPWLDDPSHVASLMKTFLAPA